MKKHTAHKRYKRHMNQVPSFMGWEIYIHRNFADYRGAYISLDISLISLVGPRGTKYFYGTEMYFNFIFGTHILFFYINIIYKY